MEQRNCPECGELVTVFKKGVCQNCYRKKYWKPRLHQCERCKLFRPIHAKGLCKTCYTYTYHLDKIKRYNYLKYHGIEMKLYKRLTKKCAICDWTILVELHHMDGNHKNIEVTNLVGLCPNHHRMARDAKYKKQIYLRLEKEGYKAPQNPKDSYDFMPK